MSAAQPARLPLVTAAGAHSTSSSAAPLSAAGFSVDTSLAEMERDLSLATKDRLQSLSVQIRREIAQRGADFSSREHHSWLRRLDRWERVFTERKLVWAKEERDRAQRMGEGGESSQSASALREAEQGYARLFGGRARLQATTPPPGDGNYGDSQAVEEGMTDPTVTRSQRVRALEASHERNLDKLHDQVVTLRGVTDEVKAETSLHLQLLQGSENQMRGVHEDVQGTRARMALVMNRAPAKCLWIIVWILIITLVVVAAEL